jgi:predicted metal-binding protein
MPAPELATAMRVLSGRIEERHLAELQRLLESEADAPVMAFDLKEVKLVDREAIRFFTACTAKGIKLENCPPYIREWIERGKGYEPNG